MTKPIQMALEKAWTVVKAFVWATVGGGTGAVVESYHQWSTYDDPLDYIAIKKLFVTGCVIGLVGWWRKEVALATPPPIAPIAVIEIIPKET